MRQNGIARRGRHRRAHIVYVGNAEIHHFAERCRRYGDAALRFLRRANQRCARARNRPLRLRRTGGAEFQRVAVLPRGVYRVPLLLFLKGIVSMALYNYS